MNKLSSAVLSVCIIATAQADVRLASTTSTQNSGLYEYLIPLLEKHINDNIQVVAVGTGQALKLAENGDADLLIVHAPTKEKAFIKSGYGVNRQALMYNQFVIVGPAQDPANVKQSTTATAAIRQIAQAGAAEKAQFVSRGDNSGTYFKEQSLWQAAGQAPSGQWYLESGSGMGSTLNIAAASNAYTLSDSSTWLKFGNKQQLVSLFTNDPVLFNQYSIILVPPARYPHVQFDKAKAIADWLTSAAGQTAINAYHINGQQAFTGNASTAVEKPSNKENSTEIPDDEDNFTY